MKAQNKRMKRVKMGVEKKHTKHLLTLWKMKPQM